MTGAAGGRRPFVHLHTHTEYSLFDGTSRLGEITRIAAEDGMPAVAITDHGNLFGALKFHRAARKVGVKPILGMEAYVAPGDRRERNPDSENQHLVLLAKNPTGYRNLMRLSSISYGDGFYFKPRMDLELLAAHHRGLIALSACPKGAVPGAIVGGGDPVEVAGRYQDVFGKGNYFLELMDHTPPGGETSGAGRLGSLERRIGEGLVRVSKRTGIPLVGTNDSHYAAPDDVEVHDLRLCISTNSRVDDPNRLRFESDQFFFKTSGAMEAVFRDHPEAYRNTLEIASRIESYELEGTQSLLPDFTLPEGSSLEDHLEESVRNGLEERLASPEVHGTRPDRAAYLERLGMELEVIRGTGYSAYFLIVQDFVRFARERRIPVGPGRGSAGGSLVAYALGITDLDPLAHGLLFERFLNPERVSPPDIDVDFCEFRREEVLDYVFERYGTDRTAHIVTTSRLQARAAVRDVGRMLGIPLPRLDRLAKRIPVGATIAQALGEVPALRTAQEEPDIARLFRLARGLEGLPRNTGIHAAGVVIAPKPLEEILPLYEAADARGGRRLRADTGEPSVPRPVRRVTQFDMKDCEAVGLFKMDFLGLRALTHIEDCAHRVERDAEVRKTAEQRRAVTSIRAGRFEKVPPDPQVFALFAAADTDGIFQFESSGMRELLRGYGPESLDDLAALNALFRPGPLESGMTGDFVRAKRRGRESDRLDPRVRALFPETRGLIVYQEQVMHAAQRLAGYSLSQADILRKAMGKKDPAVMRSEQRRFVEGAVARGLPRPVASDLFEQIAKFAGYGFNRSHAVGYALVAYVAGWLKTHFPVHFLASLLTAQQRSADKDERIARIRVGAEARGIPILPPDVQTSGAEAEVDGHGVRYGLGAVKQVGLRAAEAIAAARERCGRFESLNQLAREVEPGILNRGALESLVGAGALDFLGVSRSRIVATIPEALRCASRSRDREAAGVQLLFGEAAESTADRFAEAPSWSEAERLHREFKAFGFYWTGHPAREYRAGLASLVSGAIGTLGDRMPRNEIRVVGVVRAVRKLKTREGRPMATFQLEDDTGSVRVVAFPDTWEESGPVEADEAVVVGGRLRRAGEDSAGGSGEAAAGPGGEIVASSLLPATAAPFLTAASVELRVARPEEMKTRLRNLLSGHRGEVGLRLRLRAADSEYLLETATRVKPNRKLALEAEALLGRGSVRLDGKRPPAFALEG